MGVHGLWKLIEPAGKPVPLESLENKVLAVDVSIWLYQVTKGLQTTGGGSIPNAHLLGLFNRICKLLYYRIKPVFVFDGGVPLLKKETIEARKRLKRKAQDTSEQLREKLLNNYLKQKAIHNILGSDDIPSTSTAIDDIYVLPPLPEDEERIDDPDSSDSDTEVTTAKLESFCDTQYGKDLHSIDIHSEQFKALPAEIRHELLSELIETKKQNSWAKINEMPEDSQDFSKFQLERLKKRRDVQLSLDSATKEMGGRSMTLNELEAMFKEDGIVTDNLPGRRIVGDNVTKFVYVTSKSKAPEKKERLSVKEKRAEIENIFKNPAPEHSSPVNETKFQDKMQTIEEGIFLIDSSSDDEPEITNDTNSGEYIRSLLDKEKLSQDEILKIIKQEKNDEESSSPSYITSDTESKPANRPYPMVISDETISDEIPSDEVIPPSQEYEQTKLSMLIEKSVKVTTGNIDLERNTNIENKQLPGQSVVSKSHSIELFLDDETKENSNDEFKYSDHFDELLQTQILPKDDNERVQDEYVPKPKSLELFSDTDSDDFIEVAIEEKSSYFKKDEKSIEISINPVNMIEDDIFSDIFDNDKVNDTLPLEKSPNDGVIPGRRLNDTVPFEENNPCKRLDDTVPFEENIPRGRLDDTVLLEKSLKDTVISRERLDDTVIFEKSPNDAIIASTLNDSVIFEESPNDGIRNKNLNDTVILEKSQTNEFVSPLSGEITKLAPENTSTQKVIPVKENIENTERNQKTKVAEPMKSLASILNKVKKAETTIAKDAKETKTDSPSKQDPNKRKLAEEIQEMLSREQNELLAERGKQERLGSSITQQMIIEAQELLQLFGLPYVVAPMEAEAQCAFLDKISLTEGTITDDSDIWLFGGQKVYKNFFDSKKFVLQFRAVDIEHFFKLSREQLIQMAMLVGSDYTVGIEKIGPVTAIEILAYFSDSSNKPTSTVTIAETLRKFRTWLTTSRNKTSPLSKKCKDVSLNEAFPNTTVIDAYLYPAVDESRETFTWATPDLDRIRSYMQSKFGWKISRIDDIILPVMKRLNDKNKQSTLDKYFKQKPFSAIEFGGVSKRVIHAINFMKTKTDEQPLPTPSTSKSPKKSTQKTPPKRARKSVKKTPLKRTPTALPVQISSQNSAAKKISAPYFGELIPQKEKDKMEAAKRKLDAIKVFKAQNKSNRSKNAKKKKVLPAKPDSSYLSESSSGDDI